MSGPPRNQILTGDALTQLKLLPDDSIDCIITSPPYFRLRDYGHDDQLGLEPHVEAWVTHLRAVLTECARVLVPSGTLWLNLGDTYSTHPREGALRKSLLLGPERLALQLIADGWTIRNKIIWAKTNTVPSSVHDRLTASHEVVYLLTRSPRYYFDLNEIRIPHVSQPPRRSPRPANRAEKAGRGPNTHSDRGLGDLRASGRVGHPLGKNPGDVWAMSVSTFRSSHIATYPESLVRRIMLVGCPRLRCSHCRRPWTRQLVRHHDHARRKPPRPSCTCDAPAEPGLVLDPFIGSGTTAVVAARTGRDWLGIEINPSYAELAKERIRTSVQHNTTKSTKRKEVL
ncbi:DNA-methyltransferase [Rhodococcus ruber]|uniref:DNA-methyltransferase n=1 Tax=Rhodococcus ruber TaxID=1830 RepID=UPI001F2872C4|nr:site-specific DNA-methyltransferase [Rhodococcus ruber]MCF8785262.1 site-specific DNA-methyltransferase [Rhodococcus ruber]